VTGFPGSECRLAAGIRCQLPLGKRLAVGGDTRPLGQPSRGPSCGRTRRA